VSAKNAKLMAIFDRRTENVLRRQGKPWIHKHSFDFLPPWEMSIFDNQHADTIRPLTYQPRFVFGAVDPEDGALRQELSAGGTTFFADKMSAHQSANDNSVMFVAAKERRDLEIRVKSNKTDVEFKTRIDQRHSVNVLMAIPLPEDFIDETPESWTCP